MNCKMFRLQLDNLEPERGEFRLSPPMQTHLESCAVCHAHLHLQRRMVAALENDAAPTLPADFTAKVLGRLEPAVMRSQAKVSWRWERVAVYAGYAFVLTLALWLGYRNFDFEATTKWQDWVFAPQFQQWLTAIGASEVLLALKNSFSNLLSFIPTTTNLIEKFFGKEVLPKTFNLLIILTLTYLVTKASVFIESRLRQSSRRSP